MTKTALEYYKSGVLTDLYKKGLVSWQVHIKFEMYEHYIKNLMSNDRIEAIKLTSDEFDVSVKTIKRAIKSAES